MLIVGVKRDPTTCITSISDMPLLNLANMPFRCNQYHRTKKWFSLHTPLIYQIVRWAPDLIHIQAQCAIEYLRIPPEACIQPFIHYPCGCLKFVARNINVVDAEVSEAHTHGGKISSHRSRLCAVGMHDTAQNILFPISDLRNHW